MDESISFELGMLMINPSRVTWGVKLPPRAIFHL